MFSLYPSHIPISFPSPYISHIHKSFIIFACCPATCFFHFSFFLYRGRNRMSWCVFLVVFWCRYCGWFSSRFSFRPSTRFPRFVPRLAFGPFCPFRSSPRSSLRFSFRPSFRLFVWACRKAVRLRRGVRLVACRGGVAWRLPCAPFLSARVRWCVWASRFSFRSSRLVSRLFCSFRRGERCVASLFSLASLVSVRHFARCLGWDAVAVWCRPVSRFVSRPVLASRLSCRRWRLVLPPRVGVSCRRVDVCVLCRRASRVGVVLSRRFCQLCFPCRLVFTLSLRLLFSCSFRRACRMAACS